MIRLLTKNYSSKELFALCYLFKKMRKEMCEICSCNTYNDCTACEFHHICYDIEHATVHTKKLLNSLYRYVSSDSMHTEEDLKNVATSNYPTNAETPETKTEIPV